MRLQGDLEYLQEMEFLWGIPKPPYLEDVIPRGHICDVHPLAIDVMPVGVPAADSHSLLPKVGTCIAFLQSCMEGHQWLLKHGGGAQDPVSQALHTESSHWSSPSVESDKGPAVLLDNLPGNQSLNSY